MLFRSARVDGGAAAAPWLRRRNRVLAGRGTTHPICVTWIGSDSASSELRRVLGSDYVRPHRPRIRYQALGGGALIPRVACSLRILISGRARQPAVRPSGSRRGPLQGAPVGTKRLNCMRLRPKIPSAHRPAAGLDSPTSILCLQCPPQVLSPGSPRRAMRSLDSCCRLR